MAGWTFTLWCLAATAALLNLARRLPSQNVLATAAIVGGIGAGLALAPGWLFAFSMTGLPTEEPLSRTQSPWILPPFWITTAITCRAVAQLVVQSGAQRTNTGFWTVGLASILIPVWALSAQHTTNSHALTAGTSAAFLPGGPAQRVDLQLSGWMIAALITLVTMVPWLINKRPGKAPRDWTSLTIWLVVSLVFVSGFARQHMWPSAAMLLILMALITASARRGARQPNREAGV